MGKIPREFIHHEQGRAINPDGTKSIYCRGCGREIIRQTNPTIRSITKCAICTLKEQGVLNPEDHVLTQYAIPDPTKPPIPIEMDDSLYGGVLMLYPESEMEETGVAPVSGGVVGTVKSIFRTIGFLITGKEPPAPGKEPEQESVSKEIAKSKRGTGLYGPSRAKRS